MKAHTIKSFDGIDESNYQYWPIQQENVKGIGAISLFLGNIQIFTFAANRIDIKHGSMQI